MAEVRQAAKQVGRAEPPFAAQYQVTADWWVDMPEAEPRTRARVKPGGKSTMVQITHDGKVEHGDMVVLDETYEPEASKLWEKKTKKGES